MGVNKKSNVAYGLSNPLQSLSPEPIVSTRNPATSDLAQVGTLWINKSTNEYYVLTSTSNGSATWTTASASGSSVASLTVTGGSGTVLTVDPTGDTDLGGDLAVGGATVLTGDLTVNGDTILNGDFDISSSDAISFMSTSNTDPSISFTTNGGTAETMIFTATQGTAADALNFVATAGGIQIETSNSTAAASINLIAGSGGVQFDAVENSAWNVVGASKDIQLNATGGSISVTATEAAVDAISISAPTAGAGIEISAGGAAGVDIDIISTSGSVNISGGENVANAISLLAGAGGISIQAVGGASEPIAIQNTNDVTITSLLDGADAIYLHANAGTGEKIRIHSDQGTGQDSVELESDAGGITLTSPAANGVTINNGTQAPRIMCGTGSPNGSLTAPQGSIFLNVAGSSTSTRMYVNSDGSTAWVAFTTAS